MRSQFLDLNKYDTDKIPNGFLQIYDPLFSDYVDKEVNLLEVGVLEGASLLLWRDYFPKGHIFGVDLNIPPQLEGEDRIRLFRGSQTDTAFLSQVAGEARGGFDIIIDDASHIGIFTKVTFWHLFENHLRPGGLYVIEDWGTGYWAGWPGGAAYNNRLRNAALKLLERLGAWKGDYFYNHSFGMVGLVKQLVDEQGHAELSAGGPMRRPDRDCKFQSVTVTAPMVIIKKKLQPLPAPTAS